MTNLSPELIVFAVVVPFLLIAFNIVVLARYIDPEAAAGHYLAKLTIGNRAGLVGCGFWNNNCGGLDLTTVWQIVYCMIAGLVVVVFPFFIFYYEADDEGMQAAEESEGSCIRRLCDFRNFKRSFMSAFCYTLVTTALAAIVIAVSYMFLSACFLPYLLISIDVGAPATTAGAVWGSVDLPVSTGACVAGQSCIIPCGKAGGCVAVSSVMQLTVTIIIYMAAILSWTGWFIFSIYVGIGFVALPLDCINAFRNRPKVLTLGEARQQRKTLLKRAEELMSLGEGMVAGIVEFNDEMRDKKERRKRNKIDSAEMNRYRVLVDMLEADLDAFQLCDPQNYRAHYNPLVPWAKLLAGIFSAAISALWIIQIILYMLFTPPLHPFLNTYFSWFDTWFPLFGTLSIALFGLYLLLAVAKGNFKFGTRFFLIKVHPMEQHKTLMNSFVFNVALILLCTLAFSQYARLTDAGMLFGQQFQHLSFFRYFWMYNVFLFTILGFTLLSLIYFSIFPSDRDHLVKVMASIKAKKGAERKAFDRKLAQQGGALSAMAPIKKK